MRHCLVRGSQPTDQGQRRPLAEPNCGLVQMSLFVAAKEGTANWRGARVIMVANLIIPRYAPRYHQGPFFAVSEMQPISQ